MADATIYVVVRELILEIRCTIALASWIYAKVTCIAVPVCDTVLTANVTRWRVQSTYG